MVKPYLDTIRWEAVAKKLPSKDDPKEIRKDIREAADMVRREMGDLGKDLLTGTKAWKNSTKKFVQDTAPRVTAILDEAMSRASKAFSKTMEVVDNQSRETQVNLLRSYKIFLAKQVEYVDRKLKNMKK